MVSLHWESKREIDNIIDEIAFSRVIRFYPTYIQKITNEPLNKIFDYLLTLVEDERLDLIWEIRCPYLECNEIVLRTKEIQNYINEYIECNNCENEIFVKESIVFPNFIIKENYRERIRQSKKKEQNLSKIITSSRTVMN